MFQRGSTCLDAQHQRPVCRPSFLSLNKGNSLDIGPDETGDKGDFSLELHTGMSDSEPGTS